MAASMCRTYTWCFRKKVGNLLKSKLSIVESYRCKSELKINHAWVLDPDIEKEMEEKKFKPSKHPGMIKMKRVQLPGRLLEAIAVLQEKYPTKDLDKRAEKLANYLWARHPPMELGAFQEKAAAVERDIIEKENVNVDSLGQDELLQLEKRVKNKVMKRLRFDLYHWEPVQYDAVQGFVYMVARIAADYSVLFRVFQEIKTRDPDFRPLTVFNFGSGIGSSVWAVDSVWPSTIKEHFCMDTSADMNTIARLLLQGGEEQYDVCIPGVYFRQSFPISSKNHYDIVVSAYTLLELPSEAERLSTVLKLWRKTDKYLVLVEQGTNSGFRLINEARDFILQLGAEEEETGASDDSLIGHIFAPCPHDHPCPRLALKNKTPCNYEVNHYSLQKKAETTSTRFCYVVLKKGQRDQRVVPWPRIVREPNKVKRSMHCQLCTAKGELQYSILTAVKHSSFLYQSAKASAWGDLLPVCEGQPWSQRESPKHRKQKQQEVNSHHLVTKETQAVAQSAVYCESDNHLAGFDSGNEMSDEILEKLNTTESTTKSKISPKDISYNEEYLWSAGSDSTNDLELDNTDNDPLLSPQH